MKPRTATRLVLALQLAAGLGVSAGSTPGQSAGNKNLSTSHSGGAKPSAKKSAKKSRKRAGASSRRAKGQQAPTQDRISEIQQALAKEGSYTGTPSGKWDDETVAATKKFQEAHGLNPSGKLDAKTLQQLGLGSHTAGAAAPMPPVSSSIVASPSRTIARRQ